MHEKRSTARPQRSLPLAPSIASLDWVRRSLAEELPAEDVASIGAAAENLMAIAEENHVPIEVLVMWIHSTEGFSAATWRAYAKLYAKEVEEARNATENE
jgi:hypothetical protein